LSEVVNLRLARKRKARADKEQAALENRAIHGRTRAQKQRDRLAAEKSEAHIDGHRLKPDTDRPRT